MPQPKSRLSRLPTWISYWLGYRSTVTTQPNVLPLYMICVWSFLGAFGGLAVIQAVFGHAQYFISRNVPPIVASYGASAVLCYGAIEVPFSQPRALIGGHFISALIGVCITKLFRLLPDARYNDLEWLVASLCTAVAIVAMQVTKTTHPPAGATALLPATSREVWVVSWYFLPVVLLSSTLVLVTALFVNNLQRRYPVFWWTPHTHAITKVPLPSEKPATNNSNELQDIGQEESATQKNTRQTNLPTPSLP